MATRKRPKNAAHRKVIRLPEVIELTGIGRSTIYERKAKGLFPQSIKIGGRAVGWYLDEVLHYINSRPRSR